MLYGDYTNTGDTRTLSQSSENTCIPDLKGWTIIWTFWGTPAIPSANMNKEHMRFIVSNCKVIGTYTLLGSELVVMDQKKEVQFGVNSPIEMPTHSPEAGILKNDQYLNDLFFLYCIFGVF